MNRLEIYLQNKDSWSEIAKIVNLSYLHTYIHNCSLQPFSQHYETSFTVLILCLSGGTYSLKMTPNNRFFEKLFVALLFLLKGLCQKTAEPKKYLFHIFVLTPNLGLRKLTHILQKLINPLRVTIRFSYFFEK